jgi:DNA repair protein RecO (recombination protein O)
MPERHRVESEHAFVLHAYPYSETSLLVDLFSRRFGRLPLLAKGARRARSSLRGTLMAFQLILVGWAGRGEVRTLTRCEWVGGHPLLTGDALFCGFYLNELLMRLLPREDAHEALFDRYGEALAALARNDPPAPVLRSFEKRLLGEIGYALSLDRDAASGDPIDPAASYRYEIDRGPVRVPSTGTSGEPAFSGRALLAIAADDFRDTTTLAEGKALMRLLIGHRLDRQPLHSRTVFRALQNL